MFSNRASLHHARKYSREFFEKLVSDLRLAGFGELYVLLPHNVVDLNSAKITVEELLKRERNYSALILSSHNPATKDTIKILFVNLNNRAVFADDTFPNAQSEPPQLYVQSPDPVRCFGLVGFFREYLEKPKLQGHVLSWFVAVFSLVFIIANTFYFGNNWALATGSERRRYIPLYAFGLVIALMFLFRFFARPTGLWIKPKRELRLFYLANMALKGELKDNPLVTVIVTVLGTILTVLILKLLGLS